MADSAAEARVLVKEDGEKEPEEEPNHFEEIMTKVGPMGKWQAWIFLCVAWIQFFQTLANFNVIIFVTELHYRCELPHANPQWSFEEALQITSPLGASGETDACRRRTLDYEALAKLPYQQAMGRVNDSASLNETEECSAFVFSRKTLDVGNTLRSDFSLVCGHSALNRHSQMAFMAGILVGSLVSGFLSDRFGRKLTFTVSSAIFAIFSLAQAFTYNFTVYMAVRFMMGGLYIASIVSSFTLVLEICIAKYRSWVSGLFFVPYALGYASVSLPAFVLKDWRTVQWTATIPMFFALAFPWILPESPRWSLVRRQYARVERSLKRAARHNGGRAPSRAQLRKVAGEIGEEKSAEKDSTENFILVLKHPKLTLRTLLIFWGWIVTASVYFGSSMSASEFHRGGGLSLNLAGAVEVPAYVLCVPLLWWGRRRSLALMYLLAGLSFVFSAYVKPLWLASLIIGKMCITTAFGLIYVLTSELYPTSVRNAALSLCSFVSRFGALAAPYIAGIADDPDIGPEFAWVPVLVFAGLSLSAAVIMLFLPETRGRLPDTFRDLDGGKKAEGGTPLDPLPSSSAEA